MKQERKPKVLAIVGPTASGKSPLAMLLAARLKAHIVSADSRQCYRLLDIGTAKPSLADRSAIPHHFIDILDLPEEYNAALYAQQAQLLLQRLLGEGIVPIIAGGSGLYIRGLIDGFFDGPPKDETLRKKLQAELNEQGLPALMERLRSVDPETYANMEAGKPRRVIRALEVVEQTGKPISYWKRQSRASSPFDISQIGISWKREALYRRIHERTDWMIEQGLLNEVRALRIKGFGRELNALNTVGYKEAFETIEGIISVERMQELIRQNTRRYAKRQLTWFRADHRIRWYEMEESADVESLVEQVLRENPFLGAN